MEIRTDSLCGYSLVVILSWASPKILLVTVPPVLLSLPPWREAGLMTNVNSICPVKIFFSVFISER